MRIVAREEDEVVIFELIGRLDFEHAELVKREFQRQLGTTGKCIFDLARMEYLDCAGLGALVFCLKRSNELGGALKLIRLSGSPRQLFELTRAYKLFEIYDAPETALAAFR